MHRDIPRKLLPYTARRRVTQDIIVARIRAASTARAISFIRYVAVISALGAVPDAPLSVPYADDIA